MGLAFFLFLFWTGGGANSTPLLAMVGILFVFTVAELLISPPGLSVTTKLAPRKFQAQMVALYFLSVALGTAMAGQLAKLYSPSTEAVYFSFIGGVAIVDRHPARHHQPLGAPDDARHPLSAAARWILVRWRRFSRYAGWSSCVRTRESIGVTAIDKHRWSGVCGCVRSACTATCRPTGSTTAGASKALYAYAEEDADFWAQELGPRHPRRGSSARTCERPGSTSTARRSASAGRSVTSWSSR